MNVEPINYNDIIKKMDSHLAADGVPGRPTGFLCLNEYYTIKPGGVTDWTGFPGSGKTYFVLEVLFGEAELHQKRYALYLPDQGSDADIFEKLIKMKTGKDFTKKYNNQITESEIIHAVSWITRHFVVLRKKDFKKGITPEELWEFTCTYEDIDYGKLDGILVDSWKNLSHMYTGREDQYLDNQLSIRNEYAERYGKHFHIIAHTVKIDQTKNAERRIPNANDIKGGGAWYANGKNIITVDFPDKTKTGVNLYISKIKPESVGKVGNIVDVLYLDPRRGRYYEMINGKSYYSGQYRHMTVQEQSQISFNTPSVVEPSPF